MASPRPQCSDCSPSIRVVVRLVSHDYLTFQYAARAWTGERIQGQKSFIAPGDVVLAYPLKEVFERALPVFDFLHASELRLWVVLFRLTTRRLHAPRREPFATIFQEVA